MDGTLIFLPRKPTPLGIMLKVVVDTKSGVMLSAEVVEGKEKDGLKKYVGLYQKTTACTLRLTEPWQGSERVIIMDAWFGSVQTSVALAKVGLYSIGNVKVAHKGFPKQAILERLHQRNDRVHMAANIMDAEDRTIRKLYASGHMDT